MAAAPFSPTKSLEPEPPELPSPLCSSRCPTLPLTLASSILIRSSSFSTSPPLVIKFSCTPRPSPSAWKGSSRSFICRSLATLLSACFFRSWHSFRRDTSSEYRLASIGWALTSRSDSQTGGRVSIASGPSIRRSQRTYLDARLQYSPISSNFNPTSSPSCSTVRSATSQYSRSICSAT